MKKAYIVTYVSPDGNSRSAVKTQLELIGKFHQLTDSGRQASWLCIPTEEGENATSIRAKLLLALAPFTDGVFVARVDALDAAETDKCKCMGLLEGCKGENESELRNFNRFSSRHEAFVQYQIEKPRWIYSDGIGAAISVDFDEWCWLPVRKDGIYEKNGKYDKFLRD